MIAALIIAMSCGAAPAATNPYLPAVKRLFQDMEYEEALRAVDRAGAWQANTPADDVEVALYEGVICVELVQEERALRAFKRALAIDPSARMPFAVSPKVSASFSRARSDLHLPSAGPPQVQTAGPAAEAKKEPSWFGSARTAGAVVGAVGVASAGGAIALGVMANNEARKARSTPQVEQSSYDSHRNNANHYALGANVLYGAAGVGGVVAVILLIAGGPSEAGPSPKVAGGMEFSVSPIANGAVVGVRGGF